MREVVPQPRPADDNGTAGDSATGGAPSDHRRRRPLDAVTAKAAESPTAASSRTHRQHANTVTAASDVFSSGVVLYELATGQHPFSADSQIGVLHAVAKETPLAPSTLNPAIPERLDILIRHARRRDERGCGGQQALSPFGLPRPIPHQVHRDREQPGPDLRLAQRLTQQPDERFLRDVLRHVGIAGQPVQITEQRRIQPLEQSVEIHVAPGGGVLSTTRMRNAT